MVVKKRISYIVLMVVILSVLISSCSGLPWTQEEANRSVILDGEGLLNNRCVECHTLTRVLSARFTLEEWTVVVDRMLRKDIPMTAEERQVLIDYLFQNYPLVETKEAIETEPVTPESSVDTEVGEQLLNTRCVECHSLSRVSRQSLSLDEWRVVVDEMIREGAVLSEDEKETLIQYLAETYPEE
jgi:cytochrome c2